MTSRVSDSAASEAPVVAGPVLGRRASPWLDGGRIATSARSLLERRHPWIALVLFTAGAIVMQRHAIAHLGSAIAGNGVGDPTQFIWAMWWWPHAILHGMNPFVTHSIWVGDPFNLGAVTSVPLPSLAASPLTALFGPVVSYNLMNLIAPITGAWFAYRLCLYLTGSPASAILGGWVYGFSSYGLGQLEGHLQLVFTFAPPAMILLSLKRLDEAIGTRRYVALAAVVLIAQLLCGTEILFTMTVMGGVVLVCGLIFAPTPSRILRLLPPLMAAYAITAIVCSPFIYYALTGPEIGVGQGIIYPGDLLSFLIPTPITWLGGSSFKAVSNGYIAGFCETGTYLGLPLAAIVIAYGVESWRKPRTRILLVATAVAAIWSLGEVLNIDGHATISLPWKLVAGVKGFNETLPVRVGLFTALGCAIAASLWVARARAPRWPRWTLAALAVVFVFPNADAIAVQGGVNQPLFDEHTRTSASSLAGRTAVTSAATRSSSRSRSATSGRACSGRRRPMGTSGWRAAGSATGRATTTRIRW